jgi:ankyrin repeat protein
MSLFLPRGFDVNISPEDATCKGDVDLCKVLLDHGADPNTVVQHTSRAYPTALMTANYKLVGLLVSRGADINLIVSSSLHYNAVIDTCRRSIPCLSEEPIAHGANFDIVYPSS